MSSARRARARRRPAPTRVLLYPGYDAVLQEAARDGGGLTALLTRAIDNLCIDLGVRAQKEGQKPAALRWRSLPPTALTAEVTALDAYALAIVQLCATLRQVDVGAEHLEFRLRAQLLETAIDLLIDLERHPASEPTGPKVRDDAAAIALRACLEPLVRDL